MRFLYLVIICLGYLYPVFSQDTAWYRQKRQLELTLEGKLPPRLVLQNGLNHDLQIQHFRAEYKVHCLPLDDELTRISFMLQDMQVRLDTRSIVTRSFSVRSYNVSGTLDRYVPGFTQHKPVWAFQDTQQVVVNSAGQVLHGTPDLLALVWVGPGTVQSVLRDTISLKPLLTPLHQWNQQVKLLRELKVNDDTYYQVEYSDARRRDCYLFNINKKPPFEWQLEHNRILTLPAAPLVNVSFTLTELVSGGVRIRSEVPAPEAQIMVNTTGQLPADTGIFFEQGKPVDGNLPITQWTELNIWVKYLPDKKTISRRVVVQPGMTLRVICDTGFAGVNIEFSALQSENELMDTLYRRFRGNRIFQSQAYFQELLQLLGAAAYLDTLRSNERAELSLLEANKSGISAEAYDRFKAEITFFYGQKYYDLFGMPRGWTKDEDAEFFRLQKDYDRIDLEKPLYRTIPAYYGFITQKFDHYRLNLPGRQVGDWYLPAMLNNLSAYYSSKDFYQNFPNHYLMTEQLERCISDFNLDITTLQWILDDYRSIVRYRPFLDRVERAYQSRKKLSPGGYLPEFKAMDYDGSGFNADELSGKPWMITFLPAYQTDLPWQHLPVMEERLEVPWLLITEQPVEKEKLQRWQQEADSLGLSCHWIYLDSLREDFLNDFSISGQRLIWWPLLINTQGQIIAVSPFNASKLKEAVITLDRQAEERRRKWYRTLLSYGFGVLNLLVIFIFIKQLHKYNEEKLSQQKYLQHHQQNQRWLDKLHLWALQKWSNTIAEPSGANDLVQKLWQHTRYKEIELHKELALLQSGINTWQCKHHKPQFQLNTDIINKRILVPSALLWPYLFIACAENDIQEWEDQRMYIYVQESQGAVNGQIKLVGFEVEKIKSHPMLIENVNRLKALYPGRFFVEYQRDQQAGTLVIQWEFNPV